MFTPAYSEESLALADTARKFAKDTIIPVAGEYDELGKMPLDVFQAAWELGLMNVELPEAVGGLDVSTVEGCLIAEELAYGCAAIGTSIMCNHLGALPLMIAGTEEQQKTWLTKLVDEMCFVSYACSEPEAGSDVASMRTKLVPDGDGFTMTGQKRWITNAAHAKFFTGFATIDPSLRHKGITAFVVSADAPGITIGKKENKLGQRASNTCDVIFEDVKLGPENIHVSYIVIDGVIDLERTRRMLPDKPDDFFLSADDIAEAVYHVAHQPRSARSFEIDLRPFGEHW